MRARLLLVTGLLMASAPPAGAQSPGAGGVTLASHRSARTIVSRALDAVGGADAIDRAGGLALDGEGELDLGTLLQGRRPFEGDAHPIIERIALLPKAGRLVHEERAPINPDAVTWHRTDYRADGTYRIDMEAREATWSRPASSDRIERMIPHLLLEEILANATSLRHMGRVTVGGEAREAVTWHLPQRAQMTLLFDTRAGLLREVETLADLPVRGDATIRWSFLEHTAVPGLGLFPTGYTIHVDDERLREIRWTRRAAAPSGGILDAPAGVEMPTPAPFEAPQGGGPASGGNAGPQAKRPEFDIRDLAPGVYLLANLRTGFHMLFVEFDGFVAAVDAPSGWWELQELPARDWARSASPALGERYVTAIRSRVGDKPIRYVVLTHHHSDHAGGVRAFVHAGATVVGTELTRTVAERTLAGSLSLAGPDPAPAPLRFDVVENNKTIRDGDMEMQILDVGTNPHSEGMLAVWLPGQKILYVSDLFDPWSTRGAPARDRLPVMRWFVQWLDRSGLQPARIYAIHGAALVRPENLEEIRRGMAANRERAEQAPSRAATVVAESSWFTFHSDPRVNLHDVLLWRASSEERVEPRESCVTALPAAHRAGLADAERHYRRTIGDRSPGHGRLMLALRFHLIGKPNEIVPREDQLPTLKHLEAALPAYRACWWPDHDRRNRDWVADVMPRLERHGSAIAGPLTEAFVAEWSWPIDVDVSYANLGGANTVLRPTHVLITSRDPAYRGNGALEMLFHEASHSLVTPRSGRVAEAIRSAQSSVGVQPPRDLWHVLLFYTAGLLTQRQLALAGHDYELYMVREGLWNRAWPALRAPVETHWPAYLDGHVSLDEAVRRIISMGADPRASSRRR